MQKHEEFKESPEIIFEKFEFFELKRNLI